MNYLEEPQNPDSLANDLDALGLFELAEAVRAGLVESSAITLF